MRPLGRDLTNPSWAPVSVSLAAIPQTDRLRLTIVYAGSVLAHDLATSAWTPQPHWTFALAAWPAHAAGFAPLAGVAAKEAAESEARALDVLCWVDDFLFESSAMVTHAAARVSIVLNRNTALQPEGVFRSDAVRSDGY